MNSARHFGAARALLGRGPRWLIASAALALLAACGFAPRGTSPLPFNTLYVGVPDNSPFGASLRRQLVASSPNTAIVETVKGAEAQLQQVSQTQNLREVSLNSAGRVEQYELTLQFTFRLIDGKGNVLLPDTLLTVQRELPYNDQVVQAKEGEITVLFRNMQQILVDRIVRRITSPEVREAAQAVAAGRPISADVPVIDPSVTLPQTRPPVWEQQRMSPMDRY